MSDKINPLDNPLDPQPGMIVQAEIASGVRGVPIQVVRREHDSVSYMVAGVPHHRLDIGTFMSFENWYDWARDNGVRVVKGGE